MSFYGSVYYQLVDAFNKFVLKNTGKNSQDFPKAEEFEKEIPIQKAIGRTGEIAISTGNQWINFTKDEKENINDPNEADPPYIIWHSAPDAKANQADHGFKLLDVENDQLTDRLEDDGTIKLIDADKFETYETIYDKAGHIAKVERKTYRLPKAQVNEDVDRLKKIVGNPPDNLTILPEVEEGKENLYGYVEVNTADIRDLQDKVGDWGITGYHDYSITDVIGDINVMLNTGSSDEYMEPDEFKSFAEVIGQMNKIYELEFDSGVKTNLADTIEAIKDDLDGLDENVNLQQTVTNAQFENIAGRFGTSINDDSVYDHLNRLYSYFVVTCGQENIGDQELESIKLDKGESLKLQHTLTTLADRAKKIEDDLDWSEDYKTVSAEILDLQDRSTKLENDLNWSNTKKTVSEEIDQINATLGWSNPNSVSKEIADLHEEDAEINKTILDHFEKATAAQNALNNEDKRIADAIKIDLIPEGSTVMGEINKINATIGAVPEDYDNVVDFISTVKTNIENNIGELPEDASSISDLIQGIETDLQNQLDDIKADLGIKDDNVTNAFAAIAKNTNDIVALNNKIGISEGQTVAGLITDLNTATTKNSQDIGDIKDTYLKTEVANNTYVPLSVLGNWEDEKTIASEFNTINAIIGDTSTWGESDNTIALKINTLEGTVQNINNIIGDNSLINGETIINLLLEIKNDIKSMKTVINELHSDNEVVPFPEVVEEIPEPGPEEPIE